VVIFQILIVVKQILLSINLVLLIIACGSSKSIKNSTSQVKEKPVRIVNDGFEYEVIIFDIGFNCFLNSIAQPREYHSQSFLRNKNIFSVITYNQHVNQPTIYGDLYPLLIDYNSKINYGYEVNYLLFNYFLFFEQKYNQRL